MTLLSVHRIRNNISSQSTMFQKAFLVKLLHLARFLSRKNLAKAPLVAEPITDIVLLLGKVYCNYVMAFRNP